MFEWCGISLGQEQNYRITMALKRLYKERKPELIRFWGKILTRKKDYYVIETLITQPYPD